MAASRAGLIPMIAVVALALPSITLASEHRSRSVAREFQREHPCPATGLTTGSCPGYWRDHFVPLACGGPDAVLNMQWQTIAEAKAKDAWGGSLALGRATVCRATDKSGALATIGTGPSH